MEIKMVKRNEISADLETNNIEFTFKSNRGRPKKVVLDVEYEREWISPSEVNKYKVVYKNARRRMYELWINSLDSDMDAKWMKRWKLYRSRLKEIIYNDIDYIINHPKNIDGRSKASARLFLEKVMVDSMMTPGF